MADVGPKVTTTAGGTAAPAVSSVVTGAINTNFHTTAPADITTIAANFTALKGVLDAAINFECASSFWCDPNDLAYVRGRFAWARRMFDINLCPLWFTCTNSRKQIGTIIHEVAHKRPGAEDKAYEWDPAYATLSTADAMDNAESYAVAARQIYHGGSYGPGETC
jgi:hypothetical protein